MTYDVGNPGPALGHVQQCARFRYVTQDNTMAITQHKE